MTDESDDKGTFIRYIERRFNDAQTARLGQVNAIIYEYESQGFPLTLRQLYYQLVARGLIKNEQREYDRLGDLVSDGRMAGLVSWTAIEDRGRNLMGLPTLAGPGDAVKAARADFRLDLWADQPCRPEVWVEKQALEGVVGHICNQLRVDFFATKGYNSQSEQWRAGRRFAGYINKGQRPIVFHLGDHDPSGIDMTRDNSERLSLFAGVPITVIRLALNMDQVREVNPPENPAKIADPRANDYIAKYGVHSWELDALDPRYIHRLIDRSVAQFRDEARWSKRLAQEAADLDELDQVIEEMG